MKQKKHIRRAIQVLASLPIVVIALAGQSWIWTSLLVITALAGAFYCGYLCPFGLVQELAMDLRRKFKIKPYRISVKLDYWLKWVRYILYIAFAVFSSKAVMQLLRYDPRSNLHIILTGKGVTVAAVISISVFFVLSIYIDRFFCRYLCLKGAVYGLLSKLRIASIVRNDASCVNCRRCDKVCQMNICVSRVDHVDSMACINCFECIKACPIKNTLEFKPIPKKVISKRVLLLGLILIVYSGYTLHMNQKDFDSEAAAEAVISNEEEIGSQDREEATPEAKAIQHVTGVGEGYNGEITVKVGYDGETLVEVKVIDHQEDYDWYVEAKKPIIESILNAQSTEVDVVSGATFTSLGIIEAVQDAVDKIK